MEVLSSGTKRDWWTVVSQTRVFSAKKPFSRHYQKVDFSVGSRAPENSWGGKLDHDHSHHLCANLVIVSCESYCESCLFSYRTFLWGFEKYLFWNENFIWKCDNFFCKEFSEKKTLVLIDQYFRLDIIIGVKLKNSLNQHSKNIFMISEKDCFYSIIIFRLLTLSLSKISFLINHQK